LTTCITVSSVSSHAADFNQGVELMSKLKTLSALLMIASVTLAGGAKPAFGGTTLPPRPPIGVGSDRPIHITLSPQRALRSPARVGASAGGVIACDLRIDNPHNSGHVLGTVNVEAVITCSSQVSSLSVTAYLYPPVPYAPVRGATARGTITAKSNAAKSCTNGTYQGYARATVVIPPGYTGPTSASGFGNAIKIIC